MHLPGETEAGSAGMQPCRGIIWRAHRADAQQRGRSFSRAVHCEEKPSDDSPHALKNPRPAGAESTLTENAASPFHAEPRHECQPGIERLGWKIDMDVPDLPGIFISRRGTGVTHLYPDNSQAVA